MPHKRAKRSVREAEHAKKGYNLAPKSAGAIDDTPRSASRVLNGWNVQNAFRASGRTTSEDTGERKKRKRKQQAGGGTDKKVSGKPESSKKAEHKPKTDFGGDEPPKKANHAGPSIPRILPHESLGDYNRRVEGLLRPGVSKAIKEAKSVITAQGGKKPKGKGKDTTDEPGDLIDVSDDDLVPSRRGIKRKSEFDTAPTRKRLNDVAQAPPTLLHLKKGPQKATSVWGAKGQGKSGLSAGQERILAEERERVVARYREMKAQKEAIKGKEGNHQGGRGAKGSLS